MQYQSNGIINELMFSQHGKPGDIRVIQNMRIRNSKETLTKSPAMTVEKNGTMRGTTSDLHKKQSKICIIIQKN